MKYLLSLMLGVGTLFSANVAYAGTQNECFPCDSVNCCNLETNFYVDYLYWQPCRTDLDFGVGKNNDRRHVNPEYHSGYRIGGNVHRGCWDLGVRYTSFCSSDTRHDSGGHGDIMLKNNGDAKYKLDFEVVDIEVGRELTIGNCCGTDLRAFAGVKLAWIDEVFDRLDQGSARSELDLDGHGLYFGSEAVWDICRWNSCNMNVPIALVTRGSVGVLRTKTRNKQEGGDNGETDRGEHCAYVPVLEGYVGLQFTFENLCGCKGSGGCFNDAYFQLGYEVQSWGGLRRFADNDDTATFGIGGLVARFGFNF